MSIASLGHEILYESCSQTLDFPGLRRSGKLGIIFGFLPGPWGAPLMLVAGSFSIAIKLSRLLMLFHNVFLVDDQQIVDLKLLSFALLPLGSYLAFTSYSCRIFMSINTTLYFE